MRAISVAASHLRMHSHACFWKSKIFLAFKSRFSICDDLVYWPIIIIHHQQQSIHNCNWIVADIILCLVRFVYHLLPSIFNVNIQSRPWPISRALSQSQYSHKRANIPYIVSILKYSIRHLFNLFFSISKFCSFASVSNLPFVSLIPCDSFFDIEFVCVHYALVQLIHI